MVNDELKDVIMKKVLFCGLYLLGGAVQFIHSMESNKVKVEGYISIPKGYRPLIIRTKMPFVEFSERLQKNAVPTSAAKKGSLYILDSAVDGSIIMNEFILQRYARSAFISPWFQVDQGFQQISSDQSSSLIKQYAEFIKDKYNKKEGHSSDFGQHFVHLFFYANADKIAQQKQQSPRNFILNFFSNLFKNKQTESEEEITTKSKESLLAVLKRLEPQTIQYPSIKTINDSAFEHTNIFVDSNITVKQLQKQINSNIEFENDIFYLDDPSGLAKDFVAFEKWCR